MNNNDDKEDLLNDEEIISNDDAIPDEEEINRQINIYKQKIIEENIKKEKELLNSLNFKEILKNNKAIEALILNQIENPQLNLMNDIIILIKTDEKYKIISNENLNKKLILFLTEYKKELMNIELTKNVPVEQIKLDSIPEIKEVKEENKVYNRLYNQRKKYEIEIKEKKNILNPNSIPSNLDYLNKLYNNESSNYSKKFVYDDSINNDNIQFKINNKSNEILFNKYNKKFNEVIDDLIKNEKIKFNDRVDFNEFFILMKNLGFIDNNTSISNENDKNILLIKKMFNSLILNGGNKEYISIYNIFTFTLSILNIQNFNNNNNNLNITDKNNLLKLDNNKNLKNSNSTSSSSISFNRNKSNNFIHIPLNLTQKQSNKILKDYIFFNNNWKKNNFSSNDPNSKKNILKESYSKNKEKENTFHPITNTKYNKNIKGNLFSHINDQKNKKYETEINLNKLKQEKIDNEYTFMPKINKNYISNYTKDSVRSRYSINSIKSFATNKTSDDIVFENNLAEYTFKPNLSLSKNFSKKILNKMNRSFYLNNSFIQSDKEEEYVKNMKKTREERNYVKCFKQLRNYSYEKDFSFNNINNHRDKRNNSVCYNKNKKLCFKKRFYKKEKKRPLFILDVNLTGNNKKQLYVYKGEKTEDIVEQFVKENNINDKENEKVLIDLINEEKKKHESN